MDVSPNKLQKVDVSTTFTREPVTLFRTSQIPESKYTEVPPTPGNKAKTDLCKPKPRAVETTAHVTSKGPRPGSRGVPISTEDEIPTRWAQQIIGTLKAMTREISTIRNEIFEMKRQKAISSEIMILRREVSEINI